MGERGNSENVTLSIHPINNRCYSSSFLSLNQRNFTLHRFGSEDPGIWRKSTIFSLSGLLGREMASMEGLNELMVLRFIQD